MRIDFRCTMSAWRDHLYPIAAALPEDNRGVWWAPPDLPPPDGWAHEDPRLMDVRTRVVPIVVAGMADVYASRGLPIALLNHGAGQVYSIKNASYSGGPTREPIGLYLCPSVHDAQMNRGAYPHAEAVVIGSPKLDAHHANPTTPERPCVAFAWHWPADLVLGSGTCFLDYAPALPTVIDGLRAKGIDVIGTAHPRMIGTCRGYYERWQVPTVSLDDVFARATVMVVDNSSAGWEFMSLDRPVVWLDGPGWAECYGAGQWPRFAAPASAGLICRTPRDLPDAIDLALSDPPDQQRKRRTLIRDVIAYDDGHASQRAVEALLAWAEHAEPLSKPYSDKGYS